MAKSAHPSPKVQPSLALLIASLLLVPLSAYAGQSPSYVKQEITSDGLIADFFFKKGSTNQKGLILLGGAEGGKALSEKTQEINTLANLGFAVLVPAYFGMEGVSPTLQSVPLEYFEKAMHWLVNQKQVNHNGIAIIGGSKGSEAALLLASRHECVKVVIAVSPSAYVFWGIRGPGGKNQRTSSWSYGGKDIPYAPLVSSRETIMQAMQKRSFLKLYQEAISSPQASIGRIPLENAKAAILLLSGKKDNLWPATKMSQQIVNRLESCKYAYPVEHVAYDVGHNIPSEAPESWEKIYKFLQKNVKFGTSGG